MQAAAPTERRAQPEFQLDPRGSPLARTHACAQRKHAVTRLRPTARLSPPSGPSPRSEGPAPPRRGRTREVQRNPSHSALSQKALSSAPSPRSPLIAADSLTQWLPGEVCRRDHLSVGSQRDSLHCHGQTLPDHQHTRKHINTHRRWPPLSCP
ncbi:hypothetical protein SKAU_G00317770 [Synaphobranchus kaupii]|uniref:Uncharacterized protein n=1 Tax=Synaphobranchus kaupii TaxID=118154 RepID=A0A9Q1ET59_SYNKA|nr:hypothetical protein SKAU_G00317770 [Synaphobranchus kaupii]